MVSARIPNRHTRCLKGHVPRYTKLMETAYNHPLIVTSNLGSLVWQPEKTTHDDDNFIFGGYLFGPIELQQRTLALMTSPTFVPGIAGYGPVSEESRDRHVELGYHVIYPLRIADDSSRPVHTTRACDLVAAMTAAHGDRSVSYNDHAQQVVRAYMDAAYPGFFDDPSDADDDKSAESGPIVY